MKNFYKTIALFLALVMVFTLNPITSNAKWKDGSGDLPGMTGDSTIIALGAVAAVGVGVLVYLLIKKSNQDKATGTLENYKTMEIILWENQFIKLSNEQESKDSISQNNESEILPDLCLMPKNTLSSKIENAKNTIPVDIVVSPLSNQFAMGQANGFQVGMRIRF